MVNKTRIATVGACVGVLLGAWLVLGGSPAMALTTSDQPAAIVVYPKVVVNEGSAACTSPNNPNCPTDTLIQLSNADPINLKQAHCFYVDADSHCAGNATNAGAVCRSASDCPSGSGGALAACEPGWSETDFDVFLTKNQPLEWSASAGLTSLPLIQTGFCNGITPPRACTPQNAAQVCGSLGCNAGQSNVGSGVPPAPENPFIGSLTCIEFDPSQNPSVPDTANTLVGEATIQVVTESEPLIAKYNAVGLQSTGTNNGDNVLTIGGVTSSPPAGQEVAEYRACPQVLVLNHLFDNSPASDFTRLTLVPCGNDFETQTPGQVTAQFLVFNEFEQRFSTSRNVPCFLDSQLSLLDTTDSTRSIFNFNFIGTLSGQTRIRGVSSAATGRGLLGVATSTTGSGDLGFAARDLHQTADPIFGAPPLTQPDVITIP